MNNDIKKVLLKLERNGFEAYIVGGFVRDYLLGNQSLDIDICTNALPKDIIKVFKIKKGITNYGSISLKYGKYNIDITTYRTESNYEKHHPKNIEYVNNLLADLERRDFTINAICMNSDGKIFDFYDGKQDLDKKLIRVIGDTKTKLSEDPLRMLRAIRFSCVLNFKLDKEIENFIINNRELINTISFDRKKIELDKILASKNCSIGLEMIKKYDLFDVLGIKYDTIVFVLDLIGLWAQIDFNKNYNFNKTMLDNIKSIRKILKKGIIDSEVLLKYDLYICLVAGLILGYPKEEINKMYKDLPIHKTSDLKISNKEIMKLLNIDGSPKVKEVYNDVLSKVLNRKLKNNKRIIKKYLVKNWM